MKRPNVQLALTCPCNGMRGDLLGEGGVCISDAPLRCGHKIGGCPQQRKGAASRRSVAAAPSDKERGVAASQRPEPSKAKRGQRHAAVELLSKYFTESWLWMV